MQYYTVRVWLERINGDKYKAYLSSCATSIDFTKNKVASLRVDKSQCQRVIDFLKGNCTPSDWASLAIANSAKIVKTGPPRKPRKKVSRGRNLTAVHNPRTNHRDSVKHSLISLT